MRSFSPIMVIIAVFFRIIPVMNAQSSICSMSSIARYIEIKSILLQTVSTNQNLDAHPDLPQTKALDWLVYSDEARLCPTEEDRENIIQRYVLATLYFGLGGENWTRCGGSGTCPSLKRWLGAGETCWWHRVGCDDVGKITRLYLDDNNLSGGSIPSEISSLSDLQYLMLDSNAITGTIPNTIGELSALVYLDLDRNMISGTIPKSVYDLHSLRALDLNSNLLGGTISTRIGELVELKALHLYENYMENDIPSEIGQLKHLDNLLLHKNDFIGTVPSSVCSLSRASNFSALTADCGNLKCYCCTHCFESDRAAAVAPRAEVATERENSRRLSTKLARDYSPNTKRGAGYLRKQVVRLSS